MAHSREELSGYLSDMEQLAYARASVLSEGAGRGNRIIEVNNGSGLSFTVCPDRGMDLVEATFRGIPVAYRSAAGHRSRMEYNAEGFQWLRNWQGGLMTTCGLRNIGVPNAEFGLHGRISNAAAEDVGIVREWRDGAYRLTIRGVLREAAMFGENLRLVRTISTAYGDNSIQIDDRVCNCGATDDYLQSLYHCNFGYPLVSPEVTVCASEHEVKPRDAAAAAGLAAWSSMPEPRVGTVEQCFFHRLPVDADGLARIALVNRRLGIRVAVAHDPATLPNLVQWKLSDAGTYVIGLEPGNGSLAGRTQDIADGVAAKISAGGEVATRVRIEFGAC